MTADTDNATGGRLTRRMLGLAHLRPLMDMHAAFARGFASLEHAEEYDVLALATVATDETLSGMGIAGRGGALREDVVATIASAAMQMAPQAPPEDSWKIAEWVVQWLTNTHKSSGRARTIQFRDPDREYQWREVDVTWLREDLAPTDEAEIVLEASPAAVSATLRYLEQDLASKLVAAEAILDYHLETGQLGAAVESADNAGQVSLGYTVEVRQLLDRTRRDVAAVDWSEHVPQMLEEIHGHLERSRDREMRMLDKTEQIRADLADPDRRRQAAEVAETLLDVLKRHRQLLIDLVPARQTFLDEQRRQRFAVRQEPGAVALRADLIDPTLQMATGDATALLDGFLRDIVGPAPRPAPSLEQLLDTLLASVREVTVDPPAVIDPADLVDATTIAAHSAADWAAAEALLDSLERPTRLSELLDVARQRDIPVSPVVVLAASQATFGHGRPLIAVVDGQQITDGDFRGDDLTFHPQEVPTDG